VEGESERLKELEDWNDGMMEEKGQGQSRGLMGLRAGSPSTIFGSYPVGEMLYSIKVFLLLFYFTAFVGVGRYLIGKKSEKWCNSSMKPFFTHFRSKHIWAKIISKTTIHPPLPIPAQGRRSAGSVEGCFG